MNPIKIMNTNDIIGMMIIDPAEYNRLKQENTELHNKISQLTNESTRLNTNILEKNLEIEIESVKRYEDKTSEEISDEMNRKRKQ